MMSSPIRKPVFPLVGAAVGIALWKVPRAVDLVRAVRILDHAHTGGVWTTEEPEASEEAPSKAYAVDHGPE